MMSFVKRIVEKIRTALQRKKPPVIRWLGPKRNLDDENDPSWTHHV